MARIGAIQICDDHLDEASVECRQDLNNCLLWCGCLWDILQNRIVKKPAL
jgi:hypothetical protein